MCGGDRERDDLCVFGRGREGGRGREEGSVGGRERGREGKREREE